MSKHSDKAVELFKEGYNCSQAVFGAFAEELGLDFDTAMKISSSFGGGMGRLREVCGALTGEFMTAGMKYGYFKVNDPAAKPNHYKLIQEIAKSFKDANGSIICRELIANSQALKPEEKTDANVHKHVCSDLVRQAAENFDKIIEEQV